MKNKWHIETRLIAELVPHPKNPRQFTEKGMKDLSRSIDAFGLAEPIVVNSDDTIIGGHARILVLKQKGETECDCYVPDRQLTDKEVEELNIRLNANTAGIWDTERLNEWDLSELMDWGLDISGFGQPEATEDDYEIPAEIKTDIKRGDLFEITTNGLTHRLLCGDCTKVEDTGKLMAGEKADLLFTDPPYGIDIVNSGNVGITAKTKFGKVGTKGLVKAGSYPKIIGDDKPFDPTFLLQLAPLQIIFGANNFANKLPSNSHWLVWDKKAGIGADHNNFSDCELLWTNINKKSVRIYRYLWSGLLREGKRELELKERQHPTQKPIGLLAEIINDYSKLDNIILDIFLGSGSTMVAAHQLNRRCFGMEISPQYCQVIIDRMKKSFPDIEIKRNGIRYDMSDLKQKDISLPV